MKRLGKKVQFHGIDIVITKPYVAVDGLGMIHEYSRKPAPHRHYWRTNSFVNYLGKVDLQGMDFKETLLRFDV